MSILLYIKGLAREIFRKLWRKFISLLISLEKSSKENACLEFDISGNNKSNKIGEDFQPLLLSDLKKPKFKKIPLNNGNIVIFNHNQ